MDDPSVSDHRAFTQLLDKGFTVRVVKAEWCPTMDLIAILAQEGQLHVYRLNWQRLWTSTTEFPITAVCWRPDGRQLAVGLEDGQVLLLNTENGEVMGQSQVYEQTSVSAINWTYKQTEDESPTHSSYFDDRRVEVFFEPPVSEKDLNGAGGRVHQSSTSTASGLKGFSERFTPNLSNGNAAWPSRSTSLSVLACVSNKGEIALLSDGLFPLMKTTSVFVGLDHLEIDILGLETAPDLQSLSILWTDQGAYNLCLDQLNISTVGGNAELMRNLAMLGADIVGSMHRCAELSNTLRTHWSSAANAMQEFKNSLQSLLNQYSIYTSPQSDLLLLVTMGEYTSAMEQFLVSTMGEAGIKKVSRAIDGALCSLLDVLIDHLTPEMERLSFWLGELRTLSYLPLAQKALYLRSGEVGAAERKALHCLVDLERLRNVTTRVASQYRTFFAWLVTALRRFPEDTVDTLMGYPLSYIDEVRLFLHTEFMTDSIEPLLSSSEQNEPRHPTASQHTPQSIDLNGDFNYDQDREDESEQWLHEVLDCLEQCVDLDSSKPDVQIASPVISKIISNIGLKQHIQDLQSSILEALNRPCASISARIDINNYASSMILKTRSSHDASHVPIAALRYQDNGDVSVAYTVDTGSESHIVVTTSRNEDDCVTVSAVTMPRRIKVVNICPYKDNSWVLLSEASDVGAESYSCESTLTLIPEDIFHEGQVNNRISFSDCTVPAGLTRREGASVLDLIATSLGSARMDVDMCRKRLLPYEGCQPPLAVSSTRGTAFVLNGSQRILLFDLEEDEEDQEDEEDEGEQEDEGEGGPMSGEYDVEEEEPHTPR